MDSDTQMSVLHLKFLSIAAPLRLEDAELRTEERKVISSECQDRQHSPLFHDPHYYFAALAREEASRHCTIDNTAHPCCRPLVKTALMAANKPREMSSKKLSYRAIC